ncbi:MAG TPA: hypothetical protein PLI62_06950 [Spirochaetota bacterium]|nr:hypothetical protein [Spirochaetota bacterium]
MSILRVTTTGSYRNPYSSVVDSRGKNDPLRFMKRFSADVRPPRYSDNSANDDPLTPMRRFRKDVSPPRFSRAGQNIFRPENSGNTAFWRTGSPESDRRSTAINAYQKIKNPYTLGSQLNVFDR